MNCTPIRTFFDPAQSPPRQTHTTHSTSCTCSLLRRSGRSPSPLCLTKVLPRHIYNAFFCAELPILQTHIFLIQSRVFFCCIRWSFIRTPSTCLFSKIHAVVSSPLFFLLVQIEFAKSAGLPSTCRAFRRIPFPFFYPLGLPHFPPRSCFRIVPR